MRIKMTAVEIGMKNLRWSSLAGCAIFSLLVAGCGSGGGGSAETASATTDTPPVITETPPVITETPPVITGTPVSSVTADIVYSFAPVANDSDGDNLTFSIVNIPAWASFDSNSGVLSGQPGQNDVGQYAGIVISVSDGANSVSLAAFSIEVLGTSTGAGVASLSWSAPVLNEDNSALTDLAGYKVYYGTSRTANGQYPNVKSIGIGIQQYMVENLSPATWFFEVTALDTSGNESLFSNVASKVIL